MGDIGDSLNGDIGDCLNGDLGTETGETCNVEGECKGEGDRAFTADID